MAKGIIVLLAAAAALLGGCASEAKRAQADLVQLSAWLPGNYDNQMQVARERQEGRVPPESLTLAVVPINAEQLGSVVFYMQETTGGPNGHVTMQRLVSFSAGKDGIVESLWSLTDPARWRAADTTPELFTALQPDDLRRMEGCDLKWKKEGERFTAANDASRCRTVSPRTHSVRSMDMRVELTADELAISARSAGARAGIASGPGDDAYIRFRRNGGP